MSVPFNFMIESTEIMQRKGFGAHLNESDYTPDFIHSLNKTGLALIDLIDYVNFWTDLAVNTSDFNLSYNALLQADIPLMATVLSVRIYERFYVHLLTIVPERECASRRWLHASSTDEHFLGQQRD